jgi:integrase/recombinase XerD
VTGKGGKRALLPLAPSTREAIDEMLAGRTSGPLFVPASRKGMDRYAADDCVRRIARKAGITKRVSAHSLRHSFVTLALDAGVSLRDVQDSARHADPRTTRRYDRGRHSLDRHATCALAAYVG